MNPHLARAGVVSVFGALVASAMLSIGITLGPDGWAYWEASVSLLQGNGYSYFGGQPVVAFPPMFSVLLGLAQWAFSASGFTLIAVTAILAGMSTFVWTLPIFRSSNNTALGEVAAWAASVSIASFIGLSFTSLVADTLALLFLGALVLGLTGVRSTFGTCVTLASGVALLVTKNSSLAYFAAATGMSLLVFWRRDGRSYARGVAITALPVVSWLLVRFAFGQSTSHGGDATFSTWSYLVQTVTDLSTRWGPARWAIGATCLAALLVCIGWVMSVVAGERRVVAIHLGTAGLGVLGLVALFSAVAVHDEIGGRFLWPVVVSLLAGAGILAANNSGAHGSVKVLVFLLVVIAILQLTRAATMSAQRLMGNTLANVQPRDSLLPCRSADCRLVVPPDFPWIRREP